MAKDPTSPGGKTDTSESSEASDVRTKEKATSSNVETSNFEQAILTRNIDKAVNYFTANQNLFNYRTFRQVNGDGAQLVNRLRGVDNLDVFYKIKSSVLSLMRPKIRLYKVTYENFVSVEGRPDQGKTTVLPQPRYREIKFSDTIGTERVASAQDYLKYESTKPSWRNVGLKSFSVERDGRIAGPAQRDIDCSLTLTFKSLKDLQASPPGEPSPEQGGLRYVDLITWAPGRIDKETETYNPKHYEIKVLLGYTAPSGDQLRNLNLSESDIEAIRNIEKLNTMIALGLYNYDLKINDDGSVHLDAKYRGRIETALGSNQVSVFSNKKAGHNISNVLRILAFLNSLGVQLNKPSCKDDACEARKTLKSFIEEDSFFASVIKEEFSDGGKVKRETGIKQKGSKLIATTSGPTNVYNFFKETDNILRLQANLVKKAGLYKKESLKSFVDQLIVGNDDPGAHGTRLFCINVGPQEVQGAINILEDTTDTPGIAKPKDQLNLDEVQSSSTTAIAKGSVDIKIDRCHQLPVDVAGLSKKMGQDIGTALQIESEGKDKKAGDKPAEDPARASIRGFSGKSHKFYFVYLGDIMELACKNAGIGKLDLKSGETIRNEGFPIYNEQGYYDENMAGLGYPLQNTRILLGPLEYKNKDNKIKAINLAQFPISFNLFRSWFINKIVRPNALQLSLGSFMALIMRDLVMPSLGIGMPKNFRAPKTRQNFVSMTLPGKQSTTGKLEETLPKRQILNLDSSLFQEQYFSKLKSSARSSESMIKTSFDYLLIHVSTYLDIAKRRGIPADDLRDGIYHFNIGSDMGLLKKMNFKKVNIKGIAEARSAENEILGTDAIDQLKFPYNSDLVLVGTTLFTPGMYYYVNPSLAGLGSIEDSTSLAYKLNLGGYHLVLKTKITMTPQKFETTIVGFQVAQAERTGT